MLSAIIRTHNTFEGQHPGEKVFILIRRHWYILLSTSIAHFMLLLLPFVIYVFLKNEIASLRLVSLYFLITSGYLLIWWYSLAYAVSMYLLNTWVVTDHRILTSEQNGFFDHTTTEVPLNKIQNVSANVRGAIGTFLNFGDVEIETASTEGRFILPQVPGAYSIKDLIARNVTIYAQQHKDNQEIHINPTPATIP